MEEQKLPAGITPEMIAEAKEKRAKVSIVALSDQDGNNINDVLMGTPGVQVVNDFEKFLDSAPVKAKRILIKGVLLSHKELGDSPANTDVFSALYNGATQMLPAGKAEIKNV